LSGMFTLAKELAWKGQVDIPNDTWRLYLLDTTDYAVDYDADEYLDDVPAEALLDWVELTGMVVNGKVIDADDVNFAAPPLGASAGALLIVQWQGSAATSPLFIYTEEVEELFDGTGTPVILDGTAVPVVWSNGPYKIYAHL
jgi:hypothetical protein